MGQVRHGSAKTTHAAAGMPEAIGKRCNFGKVPAGT